jgi:hypothetical protein
MFNCELSIIGKSKLFLMGLHGLYTGGLIYGQHLVLVIISIAPVNYTVNEKKYKQTIYNLYLKQVGYLNYNTIM